MVSGSFAIIGQSLPCSVRIFQRRSIISGGRTFSFYIHFVLINFSQVVDHRIQLDQALWACRRHKRVNIQTLHYCVQKELKLRIEQWEANWEANPAFPQQEGMIIAVPPSGDAVAVEEDTSAGRSGASPLTEIDESTERSSALTNSTASTKSTRKERRSRRSPRQASEARLDAKVEREDLSERYKAAFK